MSKYQIYRDLMRFTIVRDEEVEWTGTFHLSASGYGFEATAADSSTFQLKAEGLWFWRKLTLYRNGEKVDRFEPYRSLQFDVALKRGSDIFIEGREAFSFPCQAALSDYGARLALWEFSISPYEPTVFSLILLYLQGRGQPFGG